MFLAGGSCVGINQAMVRSFAQECLYVLLICLLNIKHSMASFALWHVNNSQCKQVWSDLKADCGTWLNSIS